VTCHCQYEPIPKSQIVMPCPKNHNPDKSFAAESVLIIDKIDLTASVVLQTPHGHDMLIG